MSVVDIIRFKSLSLCLPRRVELIKETNSKMLINSNSHHVSRPHLKWATFFREQHLPTSPSFRFCLSHTIWFDPLHDPSWASTLKLPQRSGMGWGEKQWLWSTITGSTTKVLKLQSIRDRHLNFVPRPYDSPSASVIFTSSTHHHHHHHRRCVRMSVRLSMETYAAIRLWMRTLIIIAGISSMKLFVPSSRSLIRIVVARRTGVRSKRTDGRTTNEHMDGSIRFSPNFFLDFVF